MRRVYVVASRVSAVVLGCAAVSMLIAGPAAKAQGTSGAISPRPWGRISFFSTNSRTDAASGDSRRFGEFATSITYQLPDTETDGLDYGVDFRHSGYSTQGRPQRVSMYEGFVGARLAGGTVRMRAGHLWLNDLGALGAVAGGQFEYRQRTEQHSAAGRFRVGAFGGLEPQVYDFGYAAHVRKTGAYVALDGAGARRHVLGFVNIRDSSLTERSALTTTNLLPLGKKVFVYEAAEFDLTPPAGQGRRGLAYLFTNARVTATDRIEVQGSYSRGRSVDTRSLTQDVLSGRPLAQSGVEGLLYESIGGRLTVEVVRRVRVYGGYSRDVTNRDDAPTGRATFGGFASNIAGSGLDVSASDSITAGPNRGLHAQYVSVGRRAGHAVYIYGDYSTSLSILHFSRGDGVLIEMRPHTRRVSGSATVNLPASTSLLVSLERTTDGQVRDVRLLSGLTYRFR